MLCVESAFVCLLDCVDVFDVCVCVCVCVLIMKKKVLLAEGKRGFIGSCRGLFLLRWMEEAREAKWVEHSSSLRRKGRDRRKFLMLFSRNNPII